MGERRYRISFEISKRALEKELEKRHGKSDMGIIGAPGECVLRYPEDYPLHIVNTLREHGVSYKNPKVEIISKAPKQSEGAGQSCGQTDDGQVLNQLGDASKCPHCYSNNVDIMSSVITGHTYTDCRDCEALCIQSEKTLPKPCPICSSRPNRSNGFRPGCSCQSDEKEHPEDFCMFCGGELAHCDNSLWDGVWVHSVCIPY